MKLTILCLYICFGLFYSQMLCGQADFKLDLETSMAIPTYLGKVILVKGDAVKKSMKNNRESILKMNSRVGIGDIIKTSKATIVKIKMTMVDQSIFTLGSNTEFDFSEYKFNAKKEKRIIYNFIKGKMRANFPNKSNKGEISIKMRGTSMGIRGTRLLANIFDHDQEEILQVALLEGSLELKSMINNRLNIINPGDHFISVGDLKEKKFAEKVVKLDEAEAIRLNESDINFLTTLVKELSISEQVETDTQATVKINKTGNRDKKNWRNVMDKLNFLLKKYSKEDS